MNPNDAEAMLAQVKQMEAKLAERTRWPLYRHAMFGLAQGIIVAGLAQPITQAGVMIMVATALNIVCVSEDRRRNGMFVSGWQRGPTLLVTALILLFVLAMAVVSTRVRDGVDAAPLGYLLGVVTFLVCTAASLRWEKIYRAHLAKKA